MDETNVREEEAVLEDDNAIHDDFGTDEAEGGDEAEIETSPDAEGDVGDTDRESEEGGDGDESRQARKDRAKAQIERLKEENRRLKEEARKASREGDRGVGNADVMAKAYLAATFDIKERDAQDEALRLADKFDMTVDELMEDSDYREKVMSIQKRIVQNRKVAANTGGAAQRKRGAEYAAEYFKKHNEFPKDASLEVKDQAIELISGKQRQRWQT